MGGERRYCASHQEMRESVVRGLDGPGMSPLDVFPRSWQHLPGLPQELEHRQRKLARLQVPLHSHSMAMTACARNDHMRDCFPGLHFVGPPCLVSLGVLAHQTASPARHCPGPCKRALSHSCCLQSLSVEIAVAVNCELPRCLWVPMGWYGCVLVQEEGVLFLPFEQRMTRDIQQRRSARRGKGSGTLSAAPTVSDASASKASLLQDLPSGPSDAVV